MAEIPTGPWPVAPSDRMRAVWRLPPCVIPRRTSHTPAQAGTGLASRVRPVAGPTLSPWHGASVVVCFWYNASTSPKAARHLAHWRTGLRPKKLGRHCCSYWASTFVLLIRKWWMDANPIPPWVPPSLLLLLSPLLSSGSIDLAASMSASTPFPRSPPTSAAASTRSPPAAPSGLTLSRPSDSPPPTDDPDNNNNNNNNNGDARRSATRTSAAAPTSKSLASTESSQGNRMSNPLDSLLMRLRARSNAHVHAQAKNDGQA